MNHSCMVVAMGRALSGVTVSHMRSGPQRADADEFLFERGRGLAC